MRSEFKLTRPDDAEATMQTTMTVGQWKRVRAALDETKNWHTDANDFARAIRDLVNKAEAEFESTGKAEGG